MSTAFGQCDVATTQLNIAEIQLQRHQLTDAAAWLTKAHDLLRKNEEGHAVKSLQLSCVMAAIGEVAEHRGQYDQALEWHQQALAIRSNPSSHETMLGNRTGWNAPEMSVLVSHALCGVARCYAASGNYLEAVFHATRAVSIYETRRTTLDTCGNSLVRDMHRVGAKNIRDVPRIIDVYKLLGDLNRTADSLDTAKECYTRALELEQEAAGTSAIGVTALLVRMSLVNVQETDSELRPVEPEASEGGTAAKSPAAAAPQASSAKLEGGRQATAEAEAAKAAGAAIAAIAAALTAAGGSATAGNGLRNSTKALAAAVSAASGGTAGAAGASATHLQPASAAACAAASASPNVLKGALMNMFGAPQLKRQQTINGAWEFFETNLRTQEERKSLAAATQKSSTPTAIGGGAAVAPNKGGKKAIAAAESKKAQQFQQQQREDEPQFSSKAEAALVLKSILATAHTSVLPNFMEAHCYNRQKHSRGNCRTDVWSYGMALMDLFTEMRRISE